ncbi:MAG: VOC family protein [Alphaproteobacteria bacterium]|jgi:glyoxylase I family protein|nr:VOC family protein [Alphaproteobacteria bacterium]
MTAPFKLAGLDHVVLRVRDIEAMLTFYQDVLGCALAKHNEPLGLYHLAAGSSMIDLVTLDGKLGQARGAGPAGDLAAGGRNVDHIAIKIHPFDPDAIRAHLAGHGIEAGETLTRFGAEGDGPSIYLTDPEGNGVELKAV